jgi:hypothetical protein
VALPAPLLPFMPLEVFEGILQSCHLSLTRDHAAECRDTDKLSMLGVRPSSNDIRYLFTTSINTVVHMAANLITVHSNFRH